MTERSDAVRNRARVLDAAADLFARADGDPAAEPPTLAGIAAAAGVGKATVLRRFGDLTGLVEALVQPRVDALRERVEHGPAPLGPGGTAHERLHAYLDALLDFVLDNRALIRALEHRGPNAYYDNPTSRFWIGELARRATAADPASDGPVLAHALFTAVRADVLDYLRRDQGITTDRIRAVLHALAPAAHRSRAE